MWLSKVNRSSDKMSGIFLFWTPIKRNPYFQLEKQNSNYLVTDKELLPKNFLSNIKYQNTYGYYLENQNGNNETNNINNNNNNSNSNNNSNNNNESLFNKLKEKGLSNYLKEIKEKQKEITQLLNRNKKNEILEHNKLHASKNDLIQEFPNYSFITKLWIRLIPFIPVNWILKPNESFRIVSLIDQFEPNQISVSNNYNEIENHWNQLESELLNSLKVLPTIKEKQFRLDSFLNMKIHTFPTIKPSSNKSSSSSTNNVNIVS